MSLLDKLIDVLTPEESEDERRLARELASSMASRDDWLSQVLAHHRLIERIFDEVRATTDAPARRAALDRLRIVLISHESAEEAVIYPALRAAGEKGHAGTAFDEQAKLKIEMAELEKLQPMSEAFIAQLDHVEKAIRHHLYREERAWFPKLKDKALPADQFMMSARYAEEFERMSTAVAA